MAGFVERPAGRRPFDHLLEVRLARRYLLDVGYQAARRAHHVQLSVFQAQLAQQYREA